MNIKKKFLSKKSWQRLFKHLVNGDAKTILSKLLFLLKSTQRELPKTNQITIISTNHTVFIANFLSFFLEELNFQVTKLTAIPSTKYDDVIYIVICPQMFKKIPETFLAFQMEQSVSSRWFNKAYFKTLRNSVAIFEYSQKNIGFLRKNNFAYNKIFYMPICYIPNYVNNLTSKTDEFDVLFYGDANNERRQKILKTLSKKFKVKIVNNLFGDELYKIVRQSKVVLNIHYYENSLLETTRIYECLSLQTHVVSEISSDLSEFNFLEKSVTFVPESDTVAMEAAIEKILLQFNQPIDPYVLNSTMMTRFYLYRFLLANNLISFNSLYEHCNYCFTCFSNDTLVCLSLPETPERRALFSPPQHYNHFTFFDGLRFTPGWIGCGLSYKYIMSYAQKLELNRITICEDDVFFPENFNIQISKIEYYLNKSYEKWDVFCGLIADLHDDVEISNVEYIDDICYVHINRMTSMVFNIYNKSIFPLFSKWNYLDHSEDNTIDRYLEKNSNLKVITTLPFLVHHRSEETKSTLWGTNNSIYDDLIDKSEKKLTEKVKSFLKNRNTLENHLSCNIK